MNSYKKLSKLKKFKSICLIGHKDPDPDAICSMVVFREFLLNKFKIQKVEIFAECKTAPESCLPVLEDITLNPNEDNFQCAIFFDMPTKDRAGCFLSLFDKAQFKVVIDHHNTNQLNLDINIVEETSSTCEILYSIFKAFKYNPSRQSKGKLFAGILTDTGNFSVGKIGARTYKIASEYTEEINRPAIHKHFFSNTKLITMQALSLAIQNIKQYHQGKMLFSYISDKQFKDLNLTGDDCVGIINRLNSIANCNVVCFVKPKDDGYYVSMRAKDGYNVAETAKKHGGGGHIGAAGFLTDLKIEEVEQILVKELEVEATKNIKNSNNIF